MQAINNGNWKILENTLTAHITHNLDAHLTVFTGTFGILTVDHPEERETNNIKSNIIAKKPLYLSPGITNQVPIPKALYKIVVFEPSNDVFAVIVVNNHFYTKAQIEDPKEKYVICDDICESTEFLACSEKYNIKSKTEEIEYMERGYTYACKLESWSDGDIKYTGFIDGLINNYQINLEPDIYNINWRQQGF